MSQKTQYKSYSFLDEPVFYDYCFAFRHQMSQEIKIFTGNLSALSSFQDRKTADANMRQNTISETHQVSTD